MSGGDPNVGSQGSGGPNQRLLDILAHAANDFIALPTSASSGVIDRTLREVGELFMVDRAYLFEIHENGRQMSNTREWCAPGVSPERENLQDLPTDICDWWMGMLRTGQAINLASLDELPAEARGSRAILEPQGIQSLLALPLIRDGRLTGFVGFDHVRSRRVWGPVEVAILKLLVGFFGQSFERARAEQRLLLAATVFDHAHEGIFVTDANQKILEVNPGFTQITGYTRQDAVGQTPQLLSSNTHEPAFYEALWKSVLTTGHWRGEIRNLRKSGEPYLETLTISAVHGDHGGVTHYVGVFQDITQLKRQQERLQYMAYNDHLTDLPNRAQLARTMTQTLAQSQRSGDMVAVCYLDLDHFKPVNDRHGHDAGDRLLQETARRLKSALRGGDTVARLGGDEFAMLLQGLTSEADCREVLDRVIKCVREPFPITPEMSETLSASIGVRLVPADDLLERDPDALLRQADQAMYVAKQEGRGHAHFFDARSDSDSAKRKSRIGQVERSLQAGDFVILFQPIVDLKTGEPVLAEALIRWRMPGDTLKAPGELLDAIKEHRLMVDLGAFVLERALESCRTWQDAGFRSGVSVNVSARELRERDFAQNLRRLLKSLGPWPSSLLKLEVVESAALHDLAAISRLIQECSAEGVRFSLDDFGTGYSSLSYLKQLPTASLKIDQSFVAHMLFDEGDRAIVAGVIELARVFGRSSIAEGVESTAHMKLLRSMGCDLAQGYGIAEPMRLERYMNWCRAWPERRMAIMGLENDS